MFFFCDVSDFLAWKVDGKEYRKVPDLHRVNDRVGLFLLGFFHDGSQRGGTVLVIVGVNKMVNGF